MRMLLLGLALGVAVLCGCATVTKTPEENLNTVAQITDLDMRQMADDWNLIWLQDRQSRLTKWHTR
jgi:uncharacterized protein YceK